MIISIIGAGNIGASLARKLSASGHIVKITNSRGPDTIRDIARDAGARAVTHEEAVSDVDVIILAIPFGKHSELATLLSKAPANATVIDTSNYYPFRDGSIADVEHGKPESVWAGEQVGRPLIKAWNAVLAATLSDKGLPAGAAGKIALPVAGDDEKAKSITMALVSETGFEPVDAGSLTESWRQQPGTPAYCTEWSPAELKTALRDADKARAPKNRDALMDEFMSAGEALTHDHIVARNRAVSA
ncbi:NAD(P)-binding domain-containing protein [Dickeya dadantii]|uniref:NADPH-dependent F420 reductase n=1 Tax=Dickeya dadantii TaxID=204038 RepID=UPI001495F948|nr:NAD(P)-binding domain-containing protein [Dickeya dadantii]NPE57871.1 NAD(P)-binding domain-containing protein [Dickeya dadantii]NPE70012.1 NAD(P)-binding domain-containing protein [Dickeya dadantii]